nr:hypothetical protein 9 [bacterium]
MHCTASVDYCANVPEEEETTEAQLGTAIHRLAELMLDNYGIPEADQDDLASVIRDEFSIELDSFMRSTAQDYVDYCIPFIDCSECWDSESKADLSFIYPGWFGNCDFASVNLQDGVTVLNIIDLKSLSGNGYSAEDDQLKLYAMAKLYEYDALFDIERIDIHLVQPNKPKYDVKSYGLDWFKTYEKVVARTIREIESGDTRFAPSEKACKFCPRRNDCDERAEHARLIYTSAFDVIETGTDEHGILELDAKQIAEFKAKEKFMSDFFADINKQARIKIERGESVPGWKLVQGNRKRDWSDEKLAAEKLKNRKLKRDQIFPPKLISVAQAEKLLDKKSFDRLAKECVTETRNRPSLVTEEDRREALVFDGFDDETMPLAESKSLFNDAYTNI